MNKIIVEAINILRWFRHLQQIWRAGEYDPNGNITSFLRRGTTDDDTAGLIDDLNFSYNGNQLVDITDSAPTYKDAFHYADGNAHEVFGHGIALMAGLDLQANNENSVRAENLVRRLLGIDLWNGANHPGFEFISPFDALPLLNSESWK